MFNRAFPLALVVDIVNDVHEAVPPSISNVNIFVPTAAPLAVNVIAPSSSVSYPVRLIPELIVNVG